MARSVARLAINFACRRSEGAAALLSLGARTTIAAFAATTATLAAAFATEASATAATPPATLAVAVLAFATIAAFARSAVTARFRRTAAGTTTFAAIATLAALAATTTSAAATTAMVVTMTAAIVVTMTGITTPGRSLGCSRSAAEKAFQPAEKTTRLRRRGGSVGAFRLRRLSAGFVAAFATTIIPAIVPPRLARRAGIEGPRLADITRVEAPPFARRARFTFFTAFAGFIRELLAVLGRLERGPFCGIGAGAAGRGRFPTHIGPLGGLGRKNVEFRLGGRDLGSRGRSRRDLRIGSRGVDRGGAVRDRRELDGGGRDGSGLVDGGALGDGRRGGSDGSLTGERILILADRLHHFQGRRLVTGGRGGAGGGGGTRTFASGEAGALGRAEHPEGRGVGARRRLWRRGGQVGRSRSGFA